MTKNQVLFLLSTLLLINSLVAFQSGAIPMLTNMPASEFQEAGFTSEAHPKGQEEKRSLPGLRGQVLIRRDERGIPFIEANDESDLFYAQGYVTASDRLWQMDLLRRTGRGQLSEIFGRATLEEDKRRRVFGFGALSEASFNQSAPEVKAALLAYSKGVNAFIASLTETSLPAEFRILQYQPRPWTPADSIVIGDILAEVLSTTWPADIMRASLSDLPSHKREQLLAEKSPLDVLVVGKDLTKTRTRAGTATRKEASDHSLEAPRVLKENLLITRRSLERVGLNIPDLAASNNWVLSGRKTTTGKPLLANDPHLPPSAPGIWYMTSLKADGIHVAGVTIPGAPGILLGHNERIAWGATNLGPDVQDLYIESFGGPDATSYASPKGWREADIRHEIIKVRKSFTDPATDWVRFDVTVTRHGPIIFEEERKRYALKWTALNPDANAFEGFYYIDRARSWDDFRSALKRYSGPTQNFVYADVDGNIGYYGAGKIPVRKSGDGSVPYDGSTNAGEWVGFIPFDELPHVYNPPSGVIVTANQRVVGDDYPHFLTHLWAQPYRARRILDLLMAQQKLTVDDLRRIQGDTYSIASALFAREVVKLFSSRVSSGSETALASFLDSLKTWDGRFDSNSTVAPVLATMRDSFRKRILSAALSPARAQSFEWPDLDVLIDRIIVERPREWLPKEFKDYKALLYACWTDARALLATRISSDDSQWTWGRYHQVYFRHPLSAIPLVGKQFSIVPFPQNGSGGSGGTTINVGASVSMRFIGNPANWDESLQGIALGESGDPSSSHWADQLAEWQAVNPRTLAFSPLAVERAAVTLVLVPAK